MLLRRITQHIKDQNWFAVGLDVCVVIVGIFLGLQVSNWNEARKEKTEESVILERLAEDFEVIDKGFSRQIKFVATQVYRFSVVLEAIETSQIPKGEDENFKLGLLSLLHSIPSPQNSGTIDELLSNGGLKRLSDKKLRQLIFDFQTKFEIHVKQMEKFEGLVLAQRNRTAMYFKYGLPSFDQSKPFNELAKRNDINAIVDYQKNRDSSYFVQKWDLKSMQDDPKVHQSYTEAREVNLATIYWAGEVWESAVAVKDRLAELRKKLP